MRQFIRHPVDVPIEVRTDDAGPLSAFHTHDISAGGLAFLSGFAVVPGARIVPAGVVVVQRAQKMGFAYTYAG